MRKKPRDKIVGNEGRRLMNWINEIGEYIMNGTTKENKEEEFTYIEAKGCMVIDYNIRG